MRIKLYLIISLLCLCSPALAQTLQEFTGPVVRNTDLYQQNYSRDTTIGCVDTVGYPNGKATSVRFLSINTATSAQGVTQYYDAPQPITIHGVDFFAYAPSAPTPVDVYIEIYNAGPDSLPLGAPLIADTVAVDSNAGTFSLADLRRMAIFDSAITVTAPYIISFRNLNAQNTTILCNDWDNTDGMNEWLAGGDFSNFPNGGWTRSYNMNVGGTNFNADVLLHPQISFELTSAAVADKTCLTGPTTVCFDGWDVPISEHRMYNVLVFSGQANQVYSYSFGDGSPVQFGQDTCHAYASTGPYTVSHFLQHTGWANACVAIDQFNIGGTGLPIADFNPNLTGALLDPFNFSQGADTYFWDFGDGTTDTTANPSHWYTSNGTFTVTLIVTNACGTDTMTTQVTINCQFPVANFGWSRFFFQITFTDSSQNATAWEWVFGDGQANSYVQNPQHVYPVLGSYWCCLHISSPCGLDTFCDSIHLTPPVGLLLEGDAEPELKPVPSTGQMTLQLPMGFPEEFRIRVSDIAGRELRKMEIHGRTPAVALDLSALEDGIYFVEIESEKGKWVKKTVIRRE